MKTIVLDSQPLIAYFEKDKGWQTIADILEKASGQKCRLLLSVVNWGEIYYITLREYGEKYKNNVLHALENMPVELINTDKELAAQAAEIKAHGGLSYADCFAAGLAKLKKAELITGDREFKLIEKHVKIQWI